MKNMKKIFTGVAIVVALSTSSSVFADSGSKFSAFDGVPTEAVSRVQLDEVSGEALLTKAQAIDIAKLALEAVSATAGVSAKLLGTAADVAADLGKQYGYTVCKSSGSKSCPKPQYDSLYSKMVDWAAKKVAAEIAIKKPVIKIDIKTGTGSTMPTTTGLKLPK
jgi:hypothetical protein